MAIRWSEIDAVISDMDGVLWLDDTPLPGLRELFARLDATRTPYMLATNNSSKTPADYVAKLLKMGIIAVPEAAIITSGTATAAIMRDRYPAGTTVYVVGGAGLRQLLVSAGFLLVERDARVVVVGLDVTLTYDKLKAAAFCLRAGADFIATNDDPALPTPEGLAPGAGSIAAAISTAAGRIPTVIGKPHHPMFNIALARLETRPERTLMVGDRLDTDIAGGAAVGLQTALVMSGVTDHALLADSPTQPDALYRDLADLVQDWQASR